MRRGETVAVVAVCACLVVGFSSAFAFPRIGIEWAVRPLLAACLVIGYVALGYLGTRKSGGRFRA